MKQKIYFLVLLLAAVFTLGSCSSSKDDDEWSDMRLMFKSVVKTNRNSPNEEALSCMFYIFPEGDYTSIERIWGTDIGSVQTKCYAITASGEKVMNIGWSTYNKYSDSYGEALPSDINKADEYNEMLLQGSFYVVVIPSDYRCYKAKHINKPDRKKAVITTATFTYDELSPHYPIMEDLPYEEIPW